MEFIFFDWDPQRQDKNYFYAIPLKPGWAEILAEWEPDVKLVMPRKYHDMLKLYIGKIDPDYTGKVYWGAHKEVGTDDELKQSLINQDGQPLDNLDEIMLNFKTMWMHELIVPRNAIADITEADELTKLRFREAKEERWIEICERFEYPGQASEIQEHRHKLEEIREKINILEMSPEPGQELNNKLR